MMGELFAMSVAGAAMVLAILIARALLLKRLPKWVFATLWALVVVRLLVPVWIPSPTSIYNLAVQPRAESSSQQTLQQSNQLADEELTASTQVAEPSMPSSAPEEIGKEQGAGALERSAGAAQNASASEETGSPRDAGARSTASEAISAPSPEELSGLFDSGATLSAIVTVWATGAVGCAGFFAFSYLRLRRELDSSLPVEAPEARRWLDGNRLRVRPLRIRQSDRIGSPLTFGIVRPTIVVPRTFDWASDHARHTLTHELTHIRHFDTVFKLRPRWDDRCGRDRHGRHHRQRHHRAGRRRRRGHGTGCMRGARGGRPTTGGQQQPRPRGDGRAQTAMREHPHNDGWPERRPVQKAGPFTFALNGYQMLS